MAGLKMATVKSMINLSLIFIAETRFLCLLYYFNAE